MHEEPHRFAEEVAEGFALADSSGKPGVGVVEHVDKDDTEGPDVCRCCGIRRRNIVVTFEAHVWSASAIHITRFHVPRGQSKIGEFYGYLSLVFPGGRIEGSRVCDHKVFWFDVAVEDAVAMAVSDGIAHLREHGCYQTQSLGGEELLWREQGERFLGGGGAGSGFVRFVIARLFQKVEQIFTGDIIEHEQEIRGRLERMP